MLDIQSAEFIYHIMQIFMSKIYIFIHTIVIGLRHFIQLLDYLIYIILIKTNFFCVMAF